jgi:hypothetical protein
MNIKEITQYVWKNSLPISFGLTAKWKDELFTSKWSENQALKDGWKNSGAGSAPCFESGISDENKKQIEFLMNPKAGRCAVESAWR